MSAQTSLLLTCLVLTLVPILSTQLPRYFAQRKHASNEATRPSMLDGSDTDQKPSVPAFASGSSSKRPWDPPFPTTHARSKGSAWRILPPTEPRASDGSLDEVEHDVMPDRISPTPPAIRTPHIERPKEDQPTHDEPARSKPGAMSVVWTIVAVLAGILLVLLFAILIAHCLAWFIVYKTETRLGEARRGLVQGGEMRLCLCARG